MTSNWLLAAALLTPVGGAIGVLAARRAPNLREAVSLLAAAVLFACLVPFVAAVAGGARPELAVLEMLPGLRIAFRIEPLGLAFALLAAFLWFVSVLYSIGYMRAHHERNQTRFYTFFAFAIGAAVGGALAANLLTLYLFYEALTLVTYPLVTHGGSAEDRAGGRTYLTLLLGTSLLFLMPAMVWTYQLTGSLEFVDGGLFMQAGELADGVTPALLAVLFALFLFGTGKAALMPFHRWLPAAMVAPTPVSALLHAVAVVKLGVFTVLKVAVYIFGLDTLTRFGAAELMQYVAAITLLAAAVLALREDNIKRRLAYSTISQLAYIVLAAALANELALLAGGMHMVVHAFAKITLFFCAGMILVSLHKTRVSEIAGIASRMPVTITAWIVASFCVIGLPLTGGFWSKWYLARGALEAGQPLMLAVILLGSLLAMGYLLPPAVSAVFSRPAGDGRDAARAGPEAPVPALIALTITAAGTIVLFFAAEPIFALLEGFAG